MATTFTYADPPTEQTMRLATLAAAQHFGSEAIQINGAATEDSAHTVVAFRVDGWDPRGWALLGDSIVITVAADGTVQIEDEDQ